jgi:hypothetical protein
MKKRTKKKKKVARARARATMRRSAPRILSVDLDMRQNPPEFINLPAGISTNNLTIYLGGVDREITINLYGKTFRQDRPIHISPFDGKTGLYGTPGGGTAASTSLTFQAITRPKAANPHNKGDKYTLYFDDGTKLDPDIQNPGGGYSN